MNEIIKAFLKHVLVLAHLPPCDPYVRGKFISLRQKTLHIFFILLETDPRGSVNEINTASLKLFSALGHLPPCDPYVGGKFISLTDPMGSVNEIKTAFLNFFLAMVHLPPCDPYIRRKFISLRQKTLNFL